MKKIVTLLLVLVSLTSVVYAENNIDIQSMSTEELVVLRNKINAELLARDFGQKEVTVPPGRYTIGIDIPAGVYTITHGGGMFGAMIVIDNYDAIYNVMEDNPVGKLELSEGQTLEVQLGGVKFSEYKGLGF